MVLERVKRRPGWATASDFSQITNGLTISTIARAEQSPRRVLSSWARASLAWRTAKSFGPQAKRRFHPTIHPIQLLRMTTRRSTRLRFCSFVSSQEHENPEARRSASILPAARVRSHGRFPSIDRSHCTYRVRARRLPDSADGFRCRLRVRNLPRFPS